MRSTPISLFIALASASLAAGPLDPPQAPAPTQSPVEPRTAIGPETTPGDEDSTHLISEPGSYYLTGDVVGESGKIGIEVATSHVTIDLMGFEVIGTSGALWGIGPVGSGFKNVTVRNGVVRDWGADGLHLIQVDGGLVERILAAGNSGSGIRGPNLATLSDCVARGNGESGFFMGGWSIATRCIAEGNQGAGIDINLSSRAIDCQASGNARGFWLFRNAQALRCTATGNTVAGFYLGEGSMLADSVASSNFPNGVAVTGAGSVVRNNLCRDNGDIAIGTGIHLTNTAEGCRVDGNTVIENFIGVQAEGTHNMIVRNTAQGNATDFSLNANNTVGQIINFSADGQHVLDENNAGAWDNIRH